ncbi:hypothetical protein V6N13_043214 [Hibiscus sabdariffa]
MTETINSFVKAEDTWNKTTYGYINTKKRMVMARLRGIQKALCTKSYHFLLNLESELLIELENVLDQEELWRQKSRNDWAVIGDCNTRYFHRRAICRKQKRQISSLKLPNGEWCSNEAIILVEAAHFFGSLLQQVRPLTTNFHYMVCFQHCLKN